MRSAISLIIMCSLLSACGAVSQTTTWSTVAIFNDASGVFSVSDTAGNTGLGLSPNVVNEVNYANGPSSNNIADQPLSSFALVSSNSLGTIRKGTLNTGTMTGNVTVYSNPAESSHMLVFAVPHVGSMLLTQGKKLEGYPSGTYTYSGQHLNGSRAVGGSPELGSFSLSANFSSGAYTYIGSTQNTSLTGSGLLNKANGKIAGNAFTMNTPFRTYSATMYGYFSGSNAANVSGVFHSNDTNTDYAGGFVGSR